MPKVFLALVVAVTMVLGSAVNTYCHIQIVRKQAEESRFLGEETYKETMELEIRLDNLVTQRMVGFHSYH